jgi:hypothetical protein
MARWEPAGRQSAAAVALLLLAENRSFCVQFLPRIAKKVLDSQFIRLDALSGLDTPSIGCEPGEIPRHEIAAMALTYC